VIHKDPEIELDLFLIKGNQWIDIILDNKMQTQIIITESRGTIESEGTIKSIKKGSSIKFPVGVETIKINNVTTKFMKIYVIKRSSR